MGDIRNEFTFSASRARTIGECPRRYFLKVYGSWGGWDREASDRSKMLYALNKGTSAAGLVGNIVHAISAAAVQAANSGMDDMLEIEEVERAHKRFDAVVQDARDERWKGDPKGRPLLTDLFYVSDDAEDRIATMRERLERCITSLFDSRYLSAVRRGLVAGKIKLLAADDVRQRLPVNIGGETVEVFIGMDLCTSTEPAGGPKRYGIGETKTGRVNPADKKQVGLYAAALAETTGADPEQITVTTMYLEQGTEPQVRATTEMVEQGLQYVVDGARRVRELLVNRDTQINEPLPEEAWKAHVGRGCKWCDQRAACPAYQEAA